MKKILVTGGGGRFSKILKSIKRIYKNFFFNPTALESGLLRTGVSDERILHMVADFDFIFTKSVDSGRGEGASPWPSSLQLPNPSLPSLGH